MRNNKLLFGLAIPLLAASALALSHPVQAHERAYSATRVIQIGHRHYEDRGRYCRPRSHSYGKRWHGHRRHHDHHEYYRHHRERSHEGYRRGDHRYRDRDHGFIRFRIDYRDIL